MGFGSQVDLGRLLLLSVEWFGIIIITIKVARHFVTGCCLVGLDVRVGVGVVGIIGVVRSRFLALLGLGNLLLFVVFSIIIIVNFHYYFNCENFGRKMTGIVVIFYYYYWLWVGKFG